MTETPAVAPDRTKALLLSRGLGAVPRFVETERRAGAGPARVGFVPAATAGYAAPPTWLAADRRALARLGYDLVELDLTQLSGPALDDAVAGLDALYVTGGNTFVLLHHLHASGLFDSLPTHLAGGLLYIGASAGAIVAGPDTLPLSLMDDPAQAPPMISTAGLGLVDVVPVPHADGRLPPYPPRLITAIETTYGADHRLLRITDQQALYVTGGRGELVDSATRMPRRRGGDAVSRPR